MTPEEQKAKNDAEYLALVQKYEKKSLDEFGKELEDLSDEDEDDPDFDVIGFECLGCGHVQDVGGECEMCCAYACDPIYE
jgi:hypothetical protein